VTISVRPGSFAESEIEYYVRWYEARLTGLGDRLWEDVQTVVALIAKHPEIGEVVPRSRHFVRRFPLRHFPFFVIDRQRDDYLEIVALAHTSRKPGYWRSRLRRE
jgi:toxin ParE1/3/4